MDDEQFELGAVAVLRQLQEDLPVTAPSRVVVEAAIKALPPAYLEKQFTRSHRASLMQFMVETLATIEKENHGTDDQKTP